MDNINWRQSWLAGLFFASFCVLLISSCSTTGKRHDGAPDFYVDEARVPDAVPKVEPLAKHGNMPSYVVFGKRYYTMKSSKNYEAVGTASWYGTLFHSRNTSSGEPYDMLGMTAAHKTLPLPTYVEVTNLKNNRHIIVKVNDRGPFESSRLIDLSYVAAKKLGMLGHGTTQVKIKAIDPSTWSKTDNMWMASNDTNRGADFAGSPMPLKRTYTYYLQGSHHLTGGAPVSTASAAPARRTIAYSAPTSHHMNTHAMFAQHSRASYANSYRTRLSRADKARQHYANNSFASKHNARLIQTVYFQVGAFRSKQNAQQFQRRLTAQLGTPVNISRPSNKAKLYHVRIGPIRDIAAAKRLNNRLRNLGIKSNKQYGV